MKNRKAAILFLFFILLVENSCFAQFTTDTFHLGDSSIYTIKIYGDVHRHKGYILKKDSNEIHFRDFKKGDLVFRKKKIISIERFNLKEFCETLRVNNLYSSNLTPDNYFVFPSAIQPKAKQSVFTFGGTFIGATPVFTYKYGLSDNITVSFGDALLVGALYGGMAYHISFDENHHFMLSFNSGFSPILFAIEPETNFRRNAIANVSGYYTYGNSKANLTFSYGFLTNYDAEFVMNSYGIAGIMPVSQKTSFYSEIYYFNNINNNPTTSALLISSFFRLAGYRRFNFDIGLTMAANIEGNSSYRIGPFPMYKVAFNNVFKNKITKSNAIRHF